MIDALPFASAENDYYWKLLQYEVQQRRIAAFFQTLEKYEFELILIKGWAAARNYPQPQDRLAVDIDIAVNPRQYAVCARVLAEENITGIDLHKGLRHLDIIDWTDLYAAAETIEFADATRFKVLRAEDHLRVLCVHWLNDGGANRERLWDIYYAAANRPANFDWQRCLEIIGKTRRKWIVCALLIAEKYLDLDLRETPVAAESKKLPRWLIKTLETEWKRETKLKPLQDCIGSAKEFWRQLKIRMPPNAIQATIETEGEMDDTARAFYQIKDILQRAKPSLQRIGKTLSGNLRTK